MRHLVFSSSRSLLLLSAPTSSSLCFLLPRSFGQNIDDVLMATSSSSPLPPGFRFHPTDEELILHYLKNRAASLPVPVSIIADVDIYKFDPWDLPAQATFGDREWYFFTPRDRKYPNGVRPNRAAVSGYWKVTGTDKPIHAGKGKENMGIKKALVFYKGRPPKGVKTNWMMHEYRLTDARGNSYKPVKFRDSSMRLDDWVLCRIYKKNSQLQPMPELVDREQEESNAEDARELHKSFSVSDFLEDYSTVSHLLDNSPEIAAPEISMLISHHPGSSQVTSATNNNSNDSKNNSTQQQMQLGAHTAWVDESPMRRQRLNDGNYMMYADFSNQFGSLLSQSFFDQ